MYFRLLIGSLMLGMAFALFVAIVTGSQAVSSGSLAGHLLAALLFFVFALLAIWPAVWRAIRGQGKERTRGWIGVGVILVIAVAVACYMNI